ncbi:uncharacterized protein SAPINGB_P002878 [Magnusiomyces paraingens]|uniref:VLRF1 domain-containing protein n=1 Tax=Magnusiomyces paraingens TaxID=2606893 RepID=A0A5E8BHU8_9ASCO|nr:uncharacterized protein SAPINGB_P002878 [Saprochaete ingens]VVT50781.1 unnamed protein product [Saprochaete ingens]
MATTKKFKTTELYVYDLTHRFQLTPFTASVSVTQELTEENLKNLEKHNEQLTDNGVATCNYCGPIPRDTQDPDYLRNHYRRDYHRYNIKRSFQHLSPLTEDEFERLVGELDESISGSDSDDSASDSEDKTNKIEALMRKTNLESISEYNIQQQEEHLMSSNSSNNTPYFLYTAPQLPEDKTLAVYKAVLDTKFTAPKGDAVAPLAERMSESLEALNAAGTSAIFMIGGGHFSGAIISHQRLRQTPTSTNPYADVQVLAHKSFHRYTTRRKQGGSQSASDNARGKANSAGSSLRRYNEAALEKEVRELLVEWAAPYLSKTSAIYVRANGRANRAVLMSFAGSPISASDPRVKTLPFTTRRATATEIKRAWWELSHAKIINKPKEETRKQTNTTATSTSTSSSKPTEQKESPNDVHTRELTALIRRSKIPSLLAYLKKNKLDAATFRLTPADTPEYAAAPTLLHYAAARGAHSMIVPLLKTLKADPTVPNTAGRTAAQVASDKATFGAFCVARAAMGEHPAVSWDWDTDAHVGAAVTKEEQRAQDARDAEERDKVKAAEAAANRGILEEAQRAEVERIKKEKRAAEARTAAHSHTLGGGGGGGGNAGAGLTGLSALTATLLELDPENRRRFEREQRAQAIEARLKKQNI